MTILLLLLACGTVDAPDLAEAEAAVEAKVEATPLPPTRHALGTTDGRKAQAGLDDRIAALRRGMKLDPTAVPVLLEALRLRATLFGRVSDLDLQLRLSADAPPEARAQALLAMHRFDEALQIDPGVADSVALARQQDLDRLEVSRRADLEVRKTPDYYTALGDVLLAAGRPAEADAAYASALNVYRDVSPLYVADLQFRRGYALGETGPEEERDPARARQLYEDAVRVLPGFVRAQVHLAELEWQAGEKAQAIARVRGVEEAEDPEPMGKLAVWLEGEEAADYRQRTTALYEALLKRHELAYADHAAEFFAAVGEVERAKELAASDLANRNTARSRARCDELGCEPSVQ